MDDSGDEKANDRERNVSGSASKSFQLYPVYSYVDQRPFL